MVSLTPEKQVFNVNQSTTMDKMIFHVDMDAFYAAVEMRENPAYRHVPLIIGGDPKGGKGRGVASTANYEARKYGIRSAMPIGAAYQACPHGVFIRPDFQKYKPASQEVMGILAEYADVLQVVGMDEAYLDVTQRTGGCYQQAMNLARSLQAAVGRIGLSCSIGIGPNKSIAKIGSDYRKPHGITMVTQEEAVAFLRPLRVGLINGCGPKMAKSLAGKGIETIGELAAADPESLQAWHGKHGRWLWNVANGRDDRLVSASRGPAKSRGNETTFGRNKSSPGDVMAAARRLLEEILGQKHLQAFSTMTVKIRYQDFRTLTRSHTLSVPLLPGHAHTSELAMATMESLLDPLLKGEMRLVGVRLSGFQDKGGQQTLHEFQVTGFKKAASVASTWTSGLPSKT